ncbi:MAG: MATE family efflux transporter [Bacteroidales bacterium]|nr:MATE family efflux transporter [Bacteroidales bacterium]
MKQHKIDMVNGPLLSKLLVFSIPLILSSILQLLFNAADVVVVGRWAGSDALAAVGSNTSLITLLINLFVGISVGVNVVAARYYGAREDKDLSVTVHTAMTVALLSGVLLLIVGVAGAPLFLRWMACPENVLPLASLYLRIYFLGMPALMVYNFGSALLRAKGDTQRPLYFLLLAGIVNVILNLFLVIRCHLGVAGVGIATAVSQTISAALVVRCMLRETDSLKLDLKKLKIDKFKFYLILKIGLPAGLQGIVFSVSNVVIQSSVNSFGSTIMAGNAASSNIEGFVYAAMNAFYQTCLTFTGQNIGAGKPDRVDKVLLECQGLVLTTGLVLGVSAYLAGPWLLSIYSSDPAVIAAGLVRMKYICLIYFICGMMDVMVGSMRGMGHSIAPALVSMVGVCGLRLGWVATVFKAYRSPMVLYLSYPVSWTLVLIVHVICFFFIRSHVRRTLAGLPPKRLFSRKVTVEPKR